MSLGILLLLLSLCFQSHLGRHKRDGFVLIQRETRGLKTSSAESLDFFGATFGSISPPPGQQRLLFINSTWCSLETSILDLPAAAKSMFDGLIIGRGGCSFLDKAINAEKAGFRVVVITNNFEGMPAFPMTHNDKTSLNVFIVMVSSRLTTMIPSGASSGEVLLANFVDEFSVHPLECCFQRVDRLLQPRHYIPLRRVVWDCLEWVGINASSSGVIAATHEVKWFVQQGVGIVSKLRRQGAMLLEAQALLRVIGSLPLIGSVVYDSRDNEVAYALAMAWALIGERYRAFETLERVIAVQGDNGGSSTMVYLLLSVIRFAGLMSLPGPPSPDPDTFSGAAFLSPATMTPLWEHETLWLTARELTFLAHNHGSTFVLRYIDAVANTLRRLREEGEDVYGHLANIIYCPCIIDADSADKNSSGNEAITTDLESLLEPFLQLFNDISEQRTAAAEKREKEKRRGSKLLIDLLSTHVRLSVFWDEIGDLAASQVHSIAIAALVKTFHCLVIRNQDDAYTDISSGLTILASLLYRRNISSFNEGFELSKEIEGRGKTKVIPTYLVCFFSRVILGTPPISSVDPQLELERYNRQLRAMESLTDIISSVLGMSQSPSSYDLEHRIMIYLLSLESQVTLTPATMMLGYSGTESESTLLAASNRLLRQCLPAISPRRSHSYNNKDEIESSPDSEVEVEYLQSEQEQDKQQAPGEVADKDNVVRVAFISSFFYQHSVGRLISPVIASLALFQDLEVHVVALRAITQNANIVSEGDNIKAAGTANTADDITATLRSAPGIHWALLQVLFPDQGPHSSSPTYSRDMHVHTFRGAVEWLLALDADMIVYPEIGMDTLTMALSVYRLASIQAMYWGHPISQQSSGSIDYFISSELFEYQPCRRAEAVAGLRAEQTVLLSGLTTLFAPPKEPPFSLLRAADGVFSALPLRTAMKQTLLDMGISVDQRVYFLPHTMMKFSSVFDTVILDVLIRDVASVVVITYSEKQILWAEKLVLRLQKKCLLLRSDHRVNERTLSQNRYCSEWKSGVDDRLPACNKTRPGKPGKLSSSHSPASILSRVILTPRMPQEKYYEFLAHCVAVVLDPFPFGMGVTALESLAFGVPIVTLPSRQTVPALVHGMLTLLDTTLDKESADSPALGCISFVAALSAETEEEYASKAIAAAATPESHEGHFSASDCGFCSSSASLSQSAHHQRQKADAGSSFSALLRCRIKRASHVLFSKPSTTTAATTVIKEGGSVTDSTVEEWRQLIRKLAGHHHFRV